MNPIPSTLREYVQTSAHFPQVQLTLSRWCRELVLVGKVLQWLVVLIHIHELVAENIKQNLGVRSVCAEAIVDHS